MEKYQEENALLKKQIEERTGKTVEQLYAERAKRVRDAIELRVPDRVPFMVLVEPHAYSGIPNSAAYYDHIALKRTMRKMAVDLEPDMGEPGFPSCGAAMTELDIKNCVWPGGPKPPDYGYQFIEGEYMKEDEYDMFLNDPSGFMIRRYLPRVYGALAPLAKLPPLDSMFMGLEYLTPLFASPEFLEMAKHLAEAGRHVQEFRESIGNTSEELAQLGFPPFAGFGAGGVGGAPFDTVTSFLRGMKGSMLDMYRQPDKLLRACEVILERRIAHAIPADTHRKRLSSESRDAALERAIRSSCPMPNSKSFIGRDLKNLCKHTWTWATYQCRSLNPNLATDWNACWNCQKGKYWHR